MTLGEAITTVLQRVRLSTGTTDYKNQARKYLSLVAAEYLALVPGWFLDREATFKTTLTFTITGASGTFTVGETVTGGTSSETAVVDSHDTTNSKLYVYSESGTFTASETITGGTSSVTATYSSSTETRVYTPISGQVTAWWGAVDETNDYPLEIIGPDASDWLDYDRDETGQVEALFVGGLDATTGYPTIALWRIPDTTNETIRVRYRQDIATWSSSDDSTSLQVLGITRSLESALIYTASGLYLEENRQYEAAAAEGSNAARALAAHQRQAVAMQGNRRYPAKRWADDNDLVIRVGTDTVS